MVDPDELPEYLENRPDERIKWDFPTAWLLGTQLIGSLLDILMSGLFKVDNRDWMVANTIDLRSCATDDAAAPGEPCCWIDFLADTGDSTRLVFQLAYLLQQPALEVLAPVGADRVHHGRTLERPLPRGCALIIGGDTAYPIATRDQLVQRLRAPFVWARRALGDGAAPLEPPVKLLAIPGNHDYYGGLDGYQRQFRIATQRPLSGPRMDLPGYAVAQSASYFAVDLPCDWQLLALDIEKPARPGEDSRLDPRQRDYFRGEIAKPIEEPAQPPAGPPSRLPQPIHELWNRVNELSACVDGLEGSPEGQPIGEIRDAVRELATRITRLGEPADQPRRQYKNRIVVTSRPPVVYQSVTAAGEELTGILGTLGLPAPFQDGRDLAHPPAPLPPDELRLDLSGDVHLYERYWGNTVAAPEAPAERGLDLGVAAGPAQAPACKRLPPPPETWDGKTRLGNETRKRGTAESRANYASVVSGLGGAFHHPSQVRNGTITPQCAWPPAEDSARAVGERLIRPRKVLQAGVAGFLGIAVSLLSFASARAGRAGNLLDLPFFLPRCPGAMPTNLVHLAAVASYTVVIVLMIAAVYFAVQLASWLARPISDIAPRRWTWGWWTRAASHNRLAFWLLRWVGGNRRRSWRLLITAPAWLALIAFELYAIRALGHCSYFTEANDGYVALYIVISIIVLGMLAIAVFVGGRGRRFARLPLALFALVCGALVVWTPYAWMRLVSQCSWGSLCALGLFGLYMPFRRLVTRSRLFGARTQVRRVVAIALILGLAMFYVAVPYAYLHGHPIAALSHPVLGGALAAIFGAFFSCLWVGWYCLVCLQFNIHGSEAGGTARVVQYAEFLRIKLREDRAEVFVIAAEGPPPSPRSWWQFWRYDSDDLPVQARLVDHFVVERTS